MFKFQDGKIQINKRYRDIFAQYIHKGEPTPLSIGTLAVCAVCFLILIAATFSQITFVHPWFRFGLDGGGIEYYLKSVSYNPQTPAMIFIIYILGQRYSFLVLFAYLITGFFIWPVFVFGGGFEYIHNYLFGYLLGWIFAILISGTMFKINQLLKTKILGAVFGVISIHICGFLYCILLAIFKVIDFGLIFPIVNAISGSKIIYDIIFSIIAVLIAPYIKNIFWICMKPKAEGKKKLKNIRKRNQIIGNDVNQAGQYYN